MSEIKIPRNNMFANRKSNRQRAEESIANFKKLLDDKIHPDNQTDGYQNNVISTLNNLLVSANELDKENPGEGVFSLIVLSLRSCLKLRDRCNELEVENKNLKREIKKLK